MQWKELKELLGDIKMAIIEANNRGDRIRVDSLRYSRKKIKARLLEFKNNNK